MGKLSALLKERLRAKEKPKTAELAKISGEGHLSSFAGIFGNGELSEKEREHLSLLLQKYTPEGETFPSDFSEICTLTSEVKSIANQAVLLHGERIKKAQTLFKKYREGAFSAWLLATYGNRQTPYNFLQYYEFFQQMPKELHPKIEAMPKQAIYTLASRQGSLSQKEEMVEKYAGETKQEVLTLIRVLFPLNEGDKRREKVGDRIIVSLKKLIDDLEQRPKILPRDEKESALNLTEKLLALLTSCETGE